MSWRRLRRDLTALVGYAVIAVAFSWPLVLHLSTYLTGPPDGDTGVYASLAINGAGQPRVAFLAAREDVGMTGTRRSVLRLAVTSSGTPTAQTDWTLRDIDAVSLLP